MPDHDPREFGTFDAPIIRQKLSDQVFDRLWEMIRQGELSAGDYMPSERALMERFGVGRPAVREALQTMANKGLISISHGERSRVNKLTANIAFRQVDDIAKLLLSSEPSNLEHLKQLRKMLETGSIHLIVGKCKPEDIKTLRKAVEDQRAMLGHDEAFIEKDIAFHMTIARLTGNPLIEAVTQAMLSWLFAFYKPLLHWSGREQTTLREHDLIVDHLENHDLEGAVSMMENHLSRSDPLYGSQET